MTKKRLNNIKKNNEQKMKKNIKANKRIKDDNILKLSSNSNGIMIYPDSKNKIDVGAQP